ncbi:hypothetical protein EMIT019CA3_180080 [Bacillus pseudomycoides]|nr:hypothetical protein DJ94_5531 [Bacillus pseudomycoides]
MMLQGSERDVSVFISEANNPLVDMYWGYGNDSGYEGPLWKINTKTRG